MKTQHWLFCLFGVMVVTKVATADDVNFGKQIPSADQVIEALNPDKAKTRSINMDKLKAPSNTTKSKSKKQPIVTPHAKDAPPSVDTAEAALSMEIIFAYNSAELTNTAQEQLRPVGEALASGKLSNLSFVVEGHTDAVGSDSYNRTLSEERAASVKAFLVNRFGVSATQIQIIGKGKSDLLDPTHPDSEVNRRVRIVARK